MPLIFHITHKSAWETASESGGYRPASLERDGFIHCADMHQVLKVANDIFRGERELVLLCVEPANLSAGVIYEDLYGLGENSPHVYGNLEVDAIVAVLDLATTRDGVFQLPPALLSRST